jgi:hypothetical protein
MHSEKARKDAACDEPLGSWPDDPQAAIPSAQTTTASGTAATMAVARFGAAGVVHVAAVRQLLPL